MPAIFSRTVIPNSGHLQETVDFARRRIAAIKDYAGVDVNLRIRLGGPAGQILMVSSHADAGEIEAMRRKVMEGVAEGRIPQPEPGLVKSVEDAVWLDI